MNRWTIILIGLSMGSLAGWQAWRKTAAIGTGTNFQTYAQLALIWILAALMLAFVVREILRYRRWRAGHVDQEDIENAFRKAVPEKGVQWKDLRPQQVTETGRASYYFLVETWGRAGRRWPRKKQELQRFLGRTWSRQEWIGILIVGLGEVAIIGLSWIAPRFRISQHLGMIGAAGGVLVMNLLLLLFWIAGDDDEGGERPPQPETPPATGQLILRTAKSREHTRSGVSKQ